LKAEQQDKGLEWSFLQGLAGEILSETDQWFLNKASGETVD
jgi:hypothetical protein